MPLVSGVEVRKAGADDAALIDTNHAAASKRITHIQSGAWEDADMEVSAPKTEVMQVERQAGWSPVSKDQLSATVMRLGN